MLGLAPRVLMLVPLLLSAACTGMTHVPLDGDQLRLPEASARPSPDLADRGSPPQAQPTALEAMRPPGAGDPIRYFSSAFSTSFYDAAVEGYEVQDLWFPSAGDNAQRDQRVNFRYYRSSQPGPRPVLLVLPIWAGWEYPPVKLAWHLREATAGGAHVLLMMADSELIDWDGLGEVADEAELAAWADAMAERYRISLLDTLRTMDWLSAREEVDAERIGLAGFSIGALVAATALVMDERFHSSVLVMGSADPGGLVATCDGATERNREEALASLGWTQDQLHAFMSARFAHLDPASYPGRVDPRRVMIMDAAEDWCMPEAARDALWEVMGRPERWTIQYGHGSSFLAMMPIGFNVAGHRLTEFLVRQLLQPH